ncbi:MAG: PEGA domain-containing protein [bacterium]
MNYRFRISDFGFGIFYKLCAFVPLFLCAFSLCLSSIAYSKTIAFLDFEDKTLTGKGKEELNLIISSLFPSDRFTLIPREKVSRILTPAIQKEIGVITPEMAWTIGELLECDVIVIGSIEDSLSQRFVRFSFIPTSRKDDPYLKEWLLDLFLSNFGVNTKIERIISQSEIAIPLGKEDGIKIGDKFDCLKDGIKIASGEITSVEPRRSFLSISSSKEKISLFNLVRKSSFEVNKTKEFLLINTKPKASISWKGKEIGKSPIIINDKIEGDLLVSKDGFEDLKLEIENKSNPYSSLELCLYLTTLKKAEKRPLSLTVSSIPNNCEVFLDGKLAGLTPLFIPNMEEKVYEVVVKKEGFESQTQKVLIKKEEEIRVNLYPLSLPKEPSIPPKEREYLREIVSLPTSHCLKGGELEFGLTYPDIFLLKVGIPSSLKTEISLFGMGASLKLGYTDWLGISLYYRSYDMEKKEKQKDRGFWFISSLPSRFFNIHLGLGHLWKESSNCGQYFVGIDMPIKNFSLLAEYEKNGFAFGIMKPLKFFDIKLGIGEQNDETRYNLGIYIKRNRNSE